MRLVTNDSKRKVGLIGAGLQGRRRAQALGLSTKAELVAVADIDGREAQSLADETGCLATTDWKEITEREDLEIVLVCTPPDLHLPISIASLEKGKHVLCEKPLARDPDEARQIVDLAQQRRRRVKCGFNLRHHPAIRQARNLMSQNAIGEPVFMRCLYGIGGRPGYENEWRANPDVSGGGQLMDQGMHALDLARHFLGEFREVSGFLQTGFWNIGPVEDNAYALLRTEEGQVASLHASWTQWKNRFSLELFGCRGELRNGDVDRGEESVSRAV
jgi:predicted dehydrogenase